MLSPFFLSGRGTLRGPQVARRLDLSTEIDGPSTCVEAGHKRRGANRKVRGLFPGRSYVITSDPSAPS